MRDHEMNKRRPTRNLWLPLMISLVALLCVTIFDVYQSFQVRMEERKNDLVNVANAGMSIVRDYATLAQRGAMSTAEAQKQALALGVKAPLATGSRLPAAGPAVASWDYRNQSGRRR